MLKCVLLSTVLKGANKFNLLCIPLIPLLYPLIPLAAIERQKKLVEVVGNARVMLNGSYMKANVMWKL
jgi:hypothetical protein